jgi:23S rRNA (pseudouridine1915-N3)-methyltransferase
MKYVIYSLGKWKRSEEKQLFAYYQKILKNKLDLIELDHKKNLKTIEELKDFEGELLLNKITASDKNYLITLEIDGVKLSTEKLAKKIEGIKVSGKSNIILIIGGAYGLSRKISNMADLNLSLSTLTFSHLITRLVLAEQIFRVESILSGHPYHK